MRLKSLYIDGYKNLKKFSISFDSESFIDVFVGKNGSGKSNFFEALVDMFRYLYESNRGKPIIDFNFTIEYEIEEKLFSIKSNAGMLEINGKNRKTLGSTPFPDNLIVYYSGHNDKVSDIVSLYESRFKTEVVSAKESASRKIIGVGKEYKQLLLTMMLLSRDDNPAKKFICHKLGIVDIANEFRVILKRPYFAKPSDSVDPYDPDTGFWGAKGVTQEFLNRLFACKSDNQIREEGYVPSKDLYYLYINVDRFRQNFSGDLLQLIFRQFDNLKSIDMLDSISIDIQHTCGEVMSTDHFSDGQFQTVYIYSIVELFKDRNCITLLDEPDSFLHPEWQFEFMDQVFNIADAAANNHVLMSSHSAATITSSKDNLLSLFEINGSSVHITKVCRSDVIKALSGGHILLTEAEARLNINSMLKNTTRPVLFTEGITDEMILEIAWKKLFPGTTIMFEIQNAFDRIFLRNMFSRDELKTNYPRRLMFALFDFDEAYDDWNGLKGDGVKETDPLKGIVKRLKHKRHYAMLLPVPDIDVLKKQVLDDNGNPWGKGSESHISMELMFYDESWADNDKWFAKKSVSCGGTQIEFQGDKVSFARDVVPNLEPARFKVFRPMFEFIMDTCTNGS